MERGTRLFRITRRLHAGDYSTSVVCPPRGDRSSQIYIPRHEYLRAVLGYGTVVNRQILRVVLGSPRSTA